MTTRARRSLYREPDFLKLWTGETISQFGTQVSLLAIPLVAIKTLNAAPFEVGLLGTIEFLPFILFALPAGAWVDRLRRRPVLIIGDLGRVISLASIPIAFELHALTIWQLYAVGFANGVLTVFFDVAYQSYLPSLVERDQIVDGNSKLEISRSAAAIGGPGIGGILVGLVGPAVAVAADAVSFAASALGILAIRKPEPVPDRHVDEHGRRRGSMREEIGDGLRYVLGHRYLRSIAASTGWSNLFSTIGFVVYPIYMVRVLDMSAELIGAVFALGNVGALIGALVARPVADRLGVGRTIIIGMLLSAPAMLLIAVAPKSAPLPFLVASGLLYGMSALVYNINQVSLRQAITPLTMQGRMNATMRFIVWGTIPIGNIVGGALGGIPQVGLAGAIWIGALGSMFAFVPLLVGPLRSLHAMPQPFEAGDLPVGGAEAVGRALDETVEAMGSAAPRPRPDETG